MMKMFLFVVFVLGISGGVQAQDSVEQLNETSIESDFEVADQAQLKQDEQFQIQESRRLDREIKKTKAKTERLRQKNEQLSKSIAEKSKVVFEKSKVLEKENRTAESKQAEVSASEERLASLKSEIQGLNDRFKLASQQTRELQKRLGQHKLQLAKAKTQRDQLKKRLAHERERQKKLSSQFRSPRG
ncbi:MAG: hypothetical protein IT289_11270 [Oligoflexia bacterium]|nr:hypothetical protein [Oligoflexia bacterium]